ncbi:hypothetical protein [Paenibacillus herberti]|uniref:Hydrophobic protein n=1 Tax=Paenibacillus herberti TaxID=1619309 RepID=A0A229P2B0_9BACL|nr:hypothetical protein [Paenibacillus herberti]OXM16372.1 hypothetical protein CGZ75_06735 [Paenibacillus herberti]
MLILVIMILYMAKKQMKYEKVSWLRLGTIPAYCLIMLFVTFEWELRSFSYLAVFILCAYFIAKLQVSGVKVKTAPFGVNARQQAVEMCTGMNYLYGWFLVVIIIVLTEFARGELHDTRTLREELMKEIVPFMVFSNGTNNWMIWAITGITSSFYAILLMRKYPAVYLNKLNHYRK